MSKAKAKTSIETSSPLGGLSDEDAFSETSAVLMSGPKGRSMSQKDNVRPVSQWLLSDLEFANVFQFVHIDSNSDDNSDMPVAPPMHQKSTAVNPKDSEPKASRATAQLEQGKPIKAIKASSGVLVVPAPTSESSEDLSHLPEFACSAWRTSFLPTLYALLGCSHTPFVLSNDIVKSIQDTVDYAYPDTDFLVRSGDRIYNLVCKDPFTRTYTDKHIV